MRRSCRRTEEENRLHERAVKLRKMTDEKLIKHIDDLIAEARSEGAASVEAKLPNDNKVKAFLDYVETNGVAGIGKVTIHKLKLYARECGFVD